MADMPISNLQTVTTIHDPDSFVLEQDGTAKRLTGGLLTEWLLARIDGHGGIRNITGPTTIGLQDTYTINYADGMTSTFTVTNGEKGDKGDKGDTGDVNEIVATACSYAVNDSGTTWPQQESDWQDTPPEYSVYLEGRFLWARTKATYITGDVVTSYSVTRYGLDGSGTVNSVHHIAADGDRNVTVMRASGTTLLIGAV